MFPDKLPRLHPPGGGTPERLSPGARDTSSEPPSSGHQPASTALQSAPVSSAGDLAPPRRQKSRRKESAIIRQLTGPTVGQARTQAWVNENGATVYYTAQPNGVSSIPFRSFTQELRLDTLKQSAHSDESHNSRFTNNNVDSGDKCLLKIPKRYSANALFPVQNGCAAPAIPDMSARKRKMATPRTNSAAAKRQRSSWPVTKPQSTARLLDLTKCVTNDTAAKPVAELSYAEGHSQGGAHQTGKALSEVQAAAMTRPVRRSHISSWTADDVYSFVLSSPHAAIYAKVCCSVTLPGYTPLYTPRYVAPSRYQVTRRYIRQGMLLRHVTRLHAAIYAKVCCPVTLLGYTPLYTPRYVAPSRYQVTRRCIRQGMLSRHVTRLHATIYARVCCSVTLPGYTPLYTPRYVVPSHY